MFFLCHIKHRSNVWSMSFSIIYNKLSLKMFIWTWCDDRHDSGDCCFCGSDGLLQGRRRAGLCGSDGESDRIVIRIQILQSFVQSDYLVRTRIHRSGNFFLYCKQNNHNCNTELFIIELRNISSKDNQKVTFLKRNNFKLIIFQS